MTTTTNPTTAHLLDAVLRNQHAIARALNIDLPCRNVRTSNPTLPVRLRAVMKHPAAFDRALDNGYIVPTAQGRLQWTLGSNTLLAYFWGRLFCDDKPVASKTCRSLLWRQTKELFPDKDAALLFGTPNLRILRHNRQYGKLPYKHQLVDELFKSN